jgi:hypothetical protein
MTTTVPKPKSPAKPKSKPTARSTASSAPKAAAPATVEATRVGAVGTTTALQRLPDSTLHTLAAGSFGLGAGFFFSRAPRLIVLAGLMPAMVIGAAILLRPTPAVRAG